MARSKVEEGFTMLPNAVYGALTGDEIALYAYLIHRQGKNRTSFWTREKIALELAMSESKVKRVTKSLVLKGWLSVHRAPNPKGWAVNHYRVLTPIKGEEMTPSTGQIDEVIEVTGDPLKTTRKNNNQQQQVSALDEPSTLEELSILEKPYLDKPLLEKPVPNKDKGASEKVEGSNPYPDLIELLKALPKAVQGQIKITSTLNDLVAQLMITQNRSLAELKLWLGDPALWKGKFNPGGFLTSQLRKQLENGYTLQEPSTRDLTPTPPAFNAVEDSVRASLAVPMPDYVKKLAESLRERTYSE
jgi:DNA-binding MarR family transcriptional regulator